MLSLSFTRKSYGLSEIVPVSILDTEWGIWIGDVYHIPLDIPMIIEKLFKPAGHRIVIEIVVTAKTKSD